MGAEWWIGAVVGWIVTGWTVGGLIDALIINTIAGKRVFAGYRYNPRL